MSRRDSSKSKGPPSPRASEFSHMMASIASRKIVLFGCAVILALLLTAVFAPYIAPYNPYEQNLEDTLQAPSEAHWLGCDSVGRDTLSRIIYGARTSLMIGVVAISVAAFGGMALGLVAGYFGRMTYTVIMRLVDAQMCFPPILTALLVAGMLGAGLKNVMIAIGISLIPAYARLMCAQVLTVKENDYILASRSLGASSLRVMLFHVVPNCFPPLIVLITTNIGMAILSEAGLSFLGLGIAPPGAAWGGMVSDGYLHLRTHAILSFAPGLAIMCVVFAFNLVGDGLRDALDPRLRGLLNVLKSPRPSGRKDHSRKKPVQEGSIALLSVESLRTEFGTEGGVVKAVDGVSFYINEKEVIGVVGESGCGKSVTMLSILQLVSSPGRITGGKALFEGEDLLQLDPKGLGMCNIRGGKIAVVFQEPMTSLNPVLTIGSQLTEMLSVHLHMPQAKARKRAIELLGLVGIPAPSSRIDDYPYQFSGGMRQRVMIAMALSCDPRIIIADEPTTALDVTTQTELLELLTNTVRQLSASLVIVTHNLGVVARYVDRIYVMYAGRIVEAGATKDLFAFPRHPYTKGLLKSVPRLDDPPGSKLIPIRGMPPNLVDMPGTCAFFPRCGYRLSQCENSPWPGLIHIGSQHHVACHADEGTGV